MSHQEGTGWLPSGRNNLGLNRWIHSPVRKPGEKTSISESPANKQSRMKTPTKSPVAYKELLSGSETSLAPKIASTWVKLRSYFPTGSVERV
jgi:hypothetical protein